MEVQPPVRSTRRAGSADLNPSGRTAPAKERRNWVSSGFAALAISALGLALAGSMTLTGEAESVAAEPTARPVTATSTASPGPNIQGSKTQPSTTQPSKTQGSKIQGSAVTAQRSKAVEKAVIKERAAQRAEQLAKTADGIDSADRAAANAARQNTLSGAEQASRLTAAKLAQDKLRRAADAREAAVTERLRAETAKDVVAADPKSDSGTAPPTPATDPNSAPPVIPSGGRGVNPVPGAVVGAHFGQYGLWSRYHTGVDFRAGYGTPIRAVMPGMVLYAGNAGNWAGIHVAVKHADGNTTMSSHMSSLAVTPGQSVQAGQVIGYVGQTGRAFGAHLHFEVYPIGVKYGDVYRAIDPQPWLASQGVETR